MYRPCLPRRVVKVPTGARWVHEIKFDGFRLIARRDGANVSLFTKGGLDWAERYPRIVASLLKLRVTSIVLDGEVVAASFDKLWSRKYDRNAELCAFDLLELNGEDFRPLPLLDRKTRLQKLLGRKRTSIHYVEHMAGDGTIIFEQACKMGLEGIVSKRIDKPYVAGPSKAWLKIKNPAHPSIQRVKDAYRDKPWK